MTTEDGERIVRRFWEEIFGRGDIDAMDEVFAANYTLNDLVYDEKRKLDGVKSLIRNTHYDIPGIRVVVEDQRLIVGGRVFTHFTVHVSPPQDAEVPQPLTLPGGGWEYSGMTMSRVAEGKIEESWIVWEAIRAAEELGPIFGVNNWRWPPWK